MNGTVSMVDDVIRVGRPLPRIAAVAIVQALGGGWAG